MIAELFPIFLLTRPLRGATYTAKNHQRFVRISTHTPLAGRDKVRSLIFLIFVISTHTPLAGRDALTGRQCHSVQDFYSHAPCGARLPQPSIYDLFFSFLLTRPLRGATLPNSRFALPVLFLLTRPLRGATLKTERNFKLKYFYSHAPCGARRFRIEGIYWHFNFYSHAPCGARQ